MRIIRKPEVEAKVGICDRELRDLEREGHFPKRFQITPNGRAVGWVETEIDDWIAQRAATREAA